MFFTATFGTLKLELKRPNFGVSGVGEMELRICGSAEEIKRIAPSGCRIYSNRDGSARIYLKTDVETVLRIFETESKGDEQK